ncbi:MAG: hypothetical protein JWP12_2463 [Bacteroidetes bacterium]|nr:hypothetical protein [Bacteroidota bacterium]
MRTCLECNEPVVGRVDKKFCSELCRNSHNNDQQSIVNKKLKTVHSILKKNRKILENLFEQRIKKVSKEKLLRQDFNFHYITSLSYNPDGSYRYFCYEYGYHAIENDCYMLVKQ